MIQLHGRLAGLVDGWQTMVECVVIDSRYDGKVFNVAPSAIPETKTDLVSGSYPAPPAGSAVAVDREPRQPPQILNPSFKGSASSTRNVCSPVIQADPSISGTIA